MKNRRTAIKFDVKQNKNVAKDRIAEIKAREAKKAEKRNAKKDAKKEAKKDVKMDAMKDSKEEAKK